MADFGRYCGSYYGRNDLQGCWKMNGFTVILRYDGITRYYHCHTYFDAIVLMDCIEAKYGIGCVEVWKGFDKLEKKIQG